VSRGEFKEYLRAHEACSYGISFCYVDAVGCSGKVCFMDIDIYGIEAIRKVRNGDD